MMLFDDLTRKLGQFGRYQKLLFFCAGMINFLGAFNNMGIVFLAGVPDHWCSTPELSKLNLTDDTLKYITIPLVEEKNDGSEPVYSSCSRYSMNYSLWTLHDVQYHLHNLGNQTLEACPHGWEYDKSIYTSTIVSQWDLVCDNKWLQATSSSVYMAGLMCGVILISSLSDIFGRRPALILSLFGTLIFAICISFAPNVIIFCILRFCEGFFTIGAFTVGFVLGMELVGPDYRMHVGIAIEYFWAGGFLTYAMIAYFIRDWFTLNMAASGSCLVLLATLFILPESPRWLYSQGKTEQADSIVRKGAEMNKVELPAKLDVNFQKSSKGYVWDLLKTPRMACRSVNIFFTWFVVSCVYYGLSLNTSNLGGNDYINFAISGGVEIPAYAMSQVALHYAGRRLPLCVSMVIAGLVLLCTLAVPADLQWISIALAMTGKFCISASFAIIYVFTAELYPTTIRSVAVGSSSFWARVGGVVAPLIGQLSDVTSVIPLVIFGAMSLAAGLFALALPETKGQNLPETLEDGENFGRKTDNGKKKGSYNLAFIPDTPAANNNNN